MPEAIITLDRDALVCEVREVGAWKTRSGGAAIRFSEKWSCGRYFARSSVKTSFISFPLSANTHSSVW